MSTAKNWLSDNRKKVSLAGAAAVLIGAMAAGLVGVSLLGVNSSEGVVSVDVRLSVVLPAEDEAPAPE